MKTLTNLSAAFLSIAAVAAISGSALAETKPGAQPVAAYNVDINGDGSIDMRDLFDFLSAWFAGKLSTADVDRDGHLTGTDVLEYINLWFAAPTAGK